MLIIKLLLEFKDLKHSFLFLQTQEGDGFIVRLIFAIKVDKRTTGEFLLRDWNSSVTFEFFLEFSFRLKHFRELDQLFPFSLWFHAMISSIRRTMGNIVFDTRQFFQNVSPPPPTLWVESLGAFENSFALVSVSFICLFIYFYFLFSTAPRL